MAWHLPLPRPGPELTSPHATLDPEYGYGQADAGCPESMCPYPAQDLVTGRFAQSTTASEAHALTNWRLVCRAVAGNVGCTGF